MAETVVQFPQIQFSFGSNGNRKRNFPEWNFLYSARTYKQPILYYYSTGYLICQYATGKESIFPLILRQILHIPYHSLSAGCPRFLLSLVTVVSFVRCCLIESVQDCILYSIRQKKYFSVLIRIFLPANVV